MPFASPLHPYNAAAGDLVGKIFKFSKKFFYGVLQEQNFPAANAAGKFVLTVLGFVCGQIAVAARSLYGDVLVILHARTCGDEFPDDDVLFETDERIALGADGCLGEHAAGLLEGRRRKEAVRCERGFGDAEQHALCRCGHAARHDRLLVLFLEVEHIGELPGKHIGGACVLDADLSEHLADDDLDVFIVDIDALRTVDGLDFVEDIILHALDAFDADDVLRVDRTCIELGPWHHAVALFDEEFRIEGKLVIFETLLGILRRDDDVFEVIAVVKMHDAVELADGRNALGLARLEELLDAGKTLRDVARGGDTARVEGTHRELRTGLADGLRRNDADRLAHLDGSS